MFRPMVEELWNIEQFCNKNMIISKVKIKAIEAHFWYFWKVPNEYYNMEVIF